MKTLMAKCILAALSVCMSCVSSRGEGESSPVKTQLVKSGVGFQLLRGGKPYFIKGGGGGGARDVLVAAGGNSIRTWGVDGDSEKQLDECQKLGITVTLGIWMGHKEHGFDYGNAQAVQAQFEGAKKAVMRLKDHPATLIWAVGNEMEGANDIPGVWNAVEDIARMIHEVDPNHPTMTVIAEIGRDGDKVRSIQKNCPDIDIIGINSYGGGPTLGARFRKAGGAKPFVVTEFGPPGTWEIPMNAFGAAAEWTSTEKAQFYRDTYVKTVLANPDLCLGSYTFSWGYKVEATSTWFGMFLPSGDRLAAVDTMQELWSGKTPEYPCPSIQKMELLDKDEVGAGQTIRAQVKLAATDLDKNSIKWVLAREQSSYGVQGASADAATIYPDAIAVNGGSEVSVRLPRFGGIYRLYCYVTNTHRGAAVANLPIKVAGPEETFKAPVGKLPMVVYAAGAPGSPYVPSGWMGNTPAIAMEPACPDQPHAGKTCMKVEYRAKDNWGGVMWQNPADDWGEKPGGFDLTGAKKLSFWARGAAGGERVKFGYGGLGRDKRFHDSGSDSTTITLTPEWKCYTFDLRGKDLGCIKTGFSWVVEGAGAPITFYLDDIQFE